MSQTAKKQKMFATNYTAPEKYLDLQENTAVQHETRPTISI